ncbi:MAG TPA: hypothetical protein VIF14_08325 [Alphaproteobacteria bacterium]
MRRTLLALIFALAAAPAAAEQSPPGQTPPLGQVTCTVPRPQMCTQVYQPVCATRRDGTRRTYSNACMACADASVVSHVPGPCPG